MITIAVCDDDKIDLGKMAQIMREWTAAHSDMDINVHFYSSPYLLLNAISQGKVFNIFLLDILMPEMTGISLAEKLRNVCDEPIIIFLSSSEDYYPDAFRLYAFQYMRKPIRRNALSEIMDHALSRCKKSRQEMYILKTQEGIVNIPLRLITHVELLAHICHFRLSDGSDLQSRYLRTSFDSFIQPLLVYKYFIKTHSSFAVNLNYAARLAPGLLTLTTGAQIPITRSYASTVQQQYMQFVLEDKGEMS